MAQEPVDWNQLPPPANDGGADHLLGMEFPDLNLPLSDGNALSFASLKGLSVIYAYPMTGRPDVPAPDGWEMIPGAKGCTPQSCAYRDHYQDLQAAGAANVFGLSVQTSDDQREAVQRMHLPFRLISDANFQLTKALNLPVMQVNGMKLLRRLTIVVVGREIIKVNYPVFPPDQDAENVIAWLQNRQG